MQGPQVMDYEAEISCRPHRDAKLDLLDILREVVNSGSFYH